VSKSSRGSEKLWFVRHGDLPWLRANECTYIVGTMVRIYDQAFEPGFAQAVEHMRENGPITDGNERFGATRA
jgi:hypothetical protein